MPLQGGGGKVTRHLIFGSLFVKRFALCYQIIFLCVCPVLSCLPVYNVGVLWPNGWIDQDETWHGGRPQLRPHCVRWGTSPPPLKGHSSPHFSALISSCQTDAHLSNCWALVIITSANVDWFSKFCQCLIPKEMLYINVIRFFHLALKMICNDFFWLLK